MRVLSMVLVLVLVLVCGLSEPAWAGGCVDEQARAAVAIATACARVGAVKGGPKCGLKCDKPECPCGCLEGQPCRCATEKEKKAEANPLANAVAQCGPGGCGYSGSYSSYYAGYYPSYYSGCYPGYGYYAPPSYYPSYYSGYYPSYGGPWGAGFYQSYGPSFGRCGPGGCR